MDNPHCSFYTWAINQIVDNILLSNTNNINNINIENITDNLSHLSISENPAFTNITNRIKTYILLTRKDFSPIFLPMINPHRYFYLFAITQLPNIPDDFKIIMKKNIVNTTKVLSDIHSHPRDKNITFYEVGHKYDLLHPVTNKVLNPISVTTLIHAYFPHFDADAIIRKMMSGKNWKQSKYYGMTVDEIKKSWDDNRDDAAGRGTAMHAKIEYFYNDVIIKDKSIEFKYFTDFWRDFHDQYPTFKPYRTEFLVWDENFRNGKGLCGSIDLVLTDDKKNIIILDWKRSKCIQEQNRFEKGYKPFNDLEHCNKNHYMLQLNIYRHILQTKYNMKVIYLMLVILHPNQPGYQCIPVRMLDLSSIWDTL